MTQRVRRLVAAACIAVCAAPFSGVTSGAAESGGRVAGILTAPRGRSASGWDVLLVSPKGDLVASGVTGTSGAYEIANVPPGRYRIGVRDGGGNLGPVAGPDTQVASGTRVRQDIRLLASSTPRLAPAAYGAVGNSWWDRQTRNQKIFTIVGIVVGTAALWAIIDSATSNDETPASPFH